MNIPRFFLFTTVYIIIINISISKSVYENKVSSEVEEEKISSPHKRKVQNIAYIENDAIEQKPERCSRIVKIQEDADDRHFENKIKGDSLRKRTLFDSNFPYGVVYGNGRPIGILKPYPQSFELAPIREIRVPTERYVRAASSDNEYETNPIAKYLQEDAQFTNDKYPEVLTNFKINNKVRKMQEQRGMDSIGRKREETKRGNITAGQANKILQKRDTNSPNTIDEIENSLKHIITQLGLAPEEKSSIIKREAEATGNNDVVNEDEDLESGSNKIDIHKETHEQGRTKKEGKHKDKKKTHKQVAKAQDTEEDSEQEEEVDSVKRSIKSANQDATPVKKEAANYQSLGEAFLRNKRQNFVSTESTDIVKGLETSGELTVSGNKSPLASSNEETDAFKSKVTKKSTNDKAESKEYDLELEKNIQEQIKAIKEQVKREIEALKTQQPAAETLENEDGSPRQKRAIQNTLMDEEKDYLDPKINEESLKPQKRDKRDFDNDYNHELNACSTAKSVIEKRDAKVFHEQKTPSSNKISNEDIKRDLMRNSMNAIQYIPINEEARNRYREEERRAKQISLENEQEAPVSASDVLNSVAESDEIYQNLNTKSNNKKVAKAEGNDELIEIDASPNKELGSEISKPSSEATLIQKRTINEEQKEPIDSDINKDSSDSETVKRSEKEITSKNDNNVADKEKRSKEDEEEIKLANDENKFVKSGSSDCNVEAEGRERKKRKETGQNNKRKSNNVPKEKRQAIESDNINPTQDQVAQLHGVEKNEDDYEEAEIKKRNPYPEQIENNIDMQKRQSNSLYVEEKFRESDIKNDSPNKQKRDEEMETNDLKPNEKRSGRDDTHQRKALNSADKHPNNIIDPVERIKRGGGPDKHIEIDQNNNQDPNNIKPIQNIEKRSNQEGEPDKIAQVLNELQIMREKRSESTEKKSTTKHSSTEATKTVKRLAPNIVENSKPKDKISGLLELVDQTNEDDETNRKRRQVMRLEDRKIRSIEHDEPLLPDEDDSQLSDNPKTKIIETNRKRRHASKWDSSVNNAKTYKKRVKRNNPKYIKRNSIATTKAPVKKIDKSEKSRRDLSKNQPNIKGKVKQRDVKEQLKTSDSKNLKKATITKRKALKPFKIVNKKQTYIDPSLIRPRAKRSSNMLYFPYREEDEEVDEEGDEFDDDGFDDRTANFMRKREINNEQQQEEDVIENKGASNNDKRITKRHNLMHDYVADMNSDTYENTNDYLYSKQPYNRNKRQDLEEDDFSLVNDENNNRRSVKREAKMERGKERKNERNKLDENMLGLSDSDLFGSLPQSYEGELSRFKRVKRNINEHI